MKEKLQQYLNRYLVDSSIARKSVHYGALYDYQEAAPASGLSDVNQFIHEHKEEDTFQSKLFSYIDQRGLKDSDVYNKVHIDRRLFSKIRSNPDYHPSKETIILFGIALELSESELEDLLKTASYSLPMNSIFDLIIRFCFKEKIYDLNQINEFLFDHQCKTLSTD